MSGWHRAVTTCLSVKLCLQAEIDEYIKTLKFSDIFETAVPTSTSPYCGEGFTSINAGDKLHECLKLKVIAGYHGQHPSHYIGSFLQHRHGTVSTLYYLVCCTFISEVNSECRD